MTQSNRSTVQQMYQAFGTGDMNAFFKDVTEDAVWESRYPSGVPFSRTATGKVEIQRLFEIMHEELEIHAFEMGKMFSDDDTVVVLGHEVVVARKTGKKYRNDWVHVFSLRDGKVAHVQTSNEPVASQAAFVA